MVTRRNVNLGLLASAVFLVGAPARGADPSYAESPLFADRVKKGELPPLAERLPRTPVGKIRKQDVKADALDRIDAASRRQ